jgi:hypothetical protein
MPTAYEQLPAILPYFPVMPAPGYLEKRSGPSSILATNPLSLLRAGLFEDGPKRFYFLVASCLGYSWHFFFQHF